MGHIRQEFALGPVGLFRLVGKILGSLFGAQQFILAAPQRLLGPQPFIDLLGELTIPVQKSEQNQSRDKGPLGGPPYSLHAFQHPA